MKFDVITLFPEMFAPLEHSIIGKARDKDLVSLHLHYLRDWAINDYGQVDDAPYGGEAGMVLRPEPLRDALHSIGAVEEGAKPENPVIFLTPQGKPFDQQDAKDLAKYPQLTFVCGHYKGIDERIRAKYVTHEYSIGDYVLTGGELPAMVMIDAITRLLPGAMGNRESAENDSHYSGSLSWPIYTRPETFEDMKVPPVLLSGHHANITKWQRKKALKRTKDRRPDLFEKLNLTKEDRKLLKEEEIDSPSL